MSNDNKRIEIKFIAEDEYEIFQEQKNDNNSEQNGKENIEKAFLIKACENQYNADILKMEKIFDSTSNKLKSMAKHLEDFFGIRLEKSDNIKNCKKYIKFNKSNSYDWRDYLLQGPLLNNVMKINREFDDSVLKSPKMALYLLANACHDNPQILSNLGNSDVAFIQILIDIKEKQIEINERIGRKMINNLIMNKYSEREFYGNYIGAMLYIYTYINDRKNEKKLEYIEKWEEYQKNVKLIEKVEVEIENIYKEMENKEIIKADNVKYTNYKKEKFIISKPVFWIIYGLYRHYKECPLLMSRNIWRAYEGEKYRIGEKDEKFSLQSYLLVDNKRKLMNEFCKIFKSSDLYKRYINFCVSAFKEMIQCRNNEYENTVYQFEKLYALVLMHEETKIIMKKFYEYYISGQYDDIQMANTYDAFMKNQKLKLRIVAIPDIVKSIYPMFGVYNRIVTATEVLENSFKDFSKLSDSLSETEKRLKEMNLEIKKNDKAWMEKSEAEKESEQKVENYYEKLKIFILSKEGGQLESDEKWYEYLYKDIFSITKQQTTEKYEKILKSIYLLKKKIKENISGNRNKVYEEAIHLLKEMEEELLSERCGIRDLYRVLVYYDNRLNCKKDECYIFWNDISKRGKNTYELAKQLTQNIKNTIEDMNKIIENCKLSDKNNESTKENNILVVYSECKLVNNFQNETYYLEKIAYEKMKKIITKIIKNEEESKRKQDKKEIWDMVFCLWRATNQWIYDYFYMSNALLKCIANMLSYDLKDKMQELVNELKVSSFFYDTSIDNIFSKVSICASDMEEVLKSLRTEMELTYSTEKANFEEYIKTFLEWLNEKKKNVKFDEKNVDRLTICNEIESKLQELLAQVKDEIQFLCENDTEKQGKYKKKIHECIELLLNSQSTIDNIEEFILQLYYPNIMKLCASEISELLENLNEEIDNTNQKMQDDIKAFWEIDVDSQCDNVLENFKEIKDKYLLELDRIIKKQSENDEEKKDKFVESHMNKIRKSYKEKVQLEVYEKILAFYSAMKKYFAIGNRTELQNFISKYQNDERQNNEIQDNILYLNISRIIEEIQRELKCLNNEKQFEILKQKKRLDEWITEYFKDMPTEKQSFQECIYEYLEGVDQSLHDFSWKIRERETVDVVENGSVEETYSKKAADILNEIKNKLKTLSQQKLDFYEYTIQTDEIVQLINILEKDKLYLYCDNKEYKSLVEEKNQICQRINRIENKNLKKYIQEYRLNQERLKWYGKIGSYVVRKNFEDYIEY